MAKKKLKDLTLEQIVKIAVDSSEKNGCCEKCSFWKINFDCEFLCNYRNGNRKNERLKKILNYKVEVEEDVD